MAAPVALADANVLYPAALRDLLVELGTRGVIRLHWSATIHDEWTRALGLTHDPARIARTRALMDRALPDATVAGFEHLIATLTLPDPDDRHVLAAAIAAEARVIVTFNLTDFPADALAPHQITATHPDVFLTALLETAPEAVTEAVAAIHRRLTAPTLSTNDLLAVYARNGLDNFAAALSPRLNALS